MRTIIVFPVLLVFGLSNGLLLGQNMAESESSAQPVSESAKSSNSDTARSAITQADVVPSAEQEVLEKYADLAPLRKYRRHFSSLVCWRIYTPFDFHPPYGSISDDSNKDPLFGAEFLLISADRHHRIFISDAVTGEVFRDYDSRHLYSIVEYSEGFKNAYEEKKYQEQYPITHVALSPQARLFAWSCGEGHVYVRDTLIGTRFNCSDFLVGSEKILSLAFRKEYREQPFNGCDILEILSTDLNNNIFREYFAIPVGATSENNSGEFDLSKYRLTDLEGVCIKGTPDESYDIWDEEEVVVEEEDDEEYSEDVDEADIAREKRNECECFPTFGGDNQVFYNHDLESGIEICKESWDDNLRTWRRLFKEQEERKEQQEREKQKTNVDSEHVPTDISSDESEPSTQAPPLP